MVPRAGRLFLLLNAYRLEPNMRYVAWCVVDALALLEPTMPNVRLNSRVGA